MKFYLLNESPKRDDKIPLGTTDEHPGCAVVNCPACGTRGMIPHSRLGRVPVEILVRDSAYIDDIEQASSVLLLSRRFREAVTGAGLTGIAFYEPVGYKLKRDTAKFQETLRQARDVAALQVIYVTGKGGSIARSSGVALQKSCAFCGWQAWTLPEHGFHIDETQWDGSDFFHVVEYGPFFMSDRAVRALEAAKLSNFGAMPAEDFRLPPGYRQPASTAVAPPAGSPGAPRSA